MAIQPIAFVVLLEQSLPERLIAAVRVAVRKTRLVAGVALGLALVPLPPQAAFGQINSQQEQQQREQEQQRQQQQREQEQQQAREQQQRQEQQREQQQLEEQARQQQQRDQELKAQQQREQQTRDRQQRTSDFPVPSSKSGSEVSHATAKTPAAEVKHATSDIQPAGTERRPDTSLPIKPAPHPIETKPVPEPTKKTCKDGPCQDCSSTQSKDNKGGSCAAAAAAKAGAPAAPKNAGPQSCAPGTVWNGTQCVIAGAQPCTPGQIGSASCQAQCATATAGAQNFIVELRSAHQKRDEACFKDPTSRECIQADGDYNIRMSVYRNYLGSVPIGCQLPDPITI
jgi:DNA polymerase III gamma/tau subunit